MIVSRSLSTSEFGRFSAGLALASIMAPVACYGFSHALLVFYGRKDVDLDNWRAIAFKLSCIFALICAALISLYGIKVSPGISSLAIYLAFSVYPLGQAMFELKGSVYQIDAKYRLLAIWQMAPHFARLCLILVLVSADLMTRAWQASLCYAFIAIAITYVARSGQPVVELSSARSRVKELFSVSTPYGLASIFNLVYMQSAIVLVALLLGPDDAAHYSLAISIVAATYLLPTVIFQKYLLPKVHRAAGEGKAELRRIYQLGGRAMLACGVLVMLAIWLIADHFVYFAFGARYAATAEILYVLAPSIPLMYLAFSWGCILATERQIRRKVRVMGVVAAVSVALNFALILKFGITGGAYSAIICNFLLAAAYFLLCQTYFSNDE